MIRPEGAPASLVPARRAAGPALQRWGGVCALLVWSLVAQGTLAHAIRLQETWLPGVFDDGSLADPPMAASEIAALPCDTPGFTGPVAAVTGSIPPARHGSTSPPVREASRTRAPPLA